MIFVFHFHGSKFSVYHTAPLRRRGAVLGFRIYDQLWSAFFSCMDGYRSVEFLAVRSGMSGFFEPVSTLYVFSMVPLVRYYGTVGLVGYVRRYLVWEVEYGARWGQDDTTDSSDWLKNCRSIDVAFKWSFNSYFTSVPRDVQMAFQ
jgi:hypothetical protein